jgi:CDGSH-type Zn-finger protein
VSGEATTVPDVTITIDEDGSYIVDGDIRLTDDEGRELDLPYDFQLCRCGHSGNQPFCDGAHAVLGPMEVARLGACVDDRDARVLV